MQTALVTGSSGLIGSETVEYLDRHGWRVHGIDNNMRRDFFGAHGDTTWNLERLRAERSGSSTTSSMYATARRYAARRRAPAEPDRPRRRPALARSRRQRPTTTSRSMRSARSTCWRRAHGARRRRPFVFLSTNKVYGDAPNELPLVELETAGTTPTRRSGRASTSDADRQTMHSLFGASKVAADVLVQEYGRYFGMPTVCFRGGCLTGPNHSGAELHGFLAYLRSSRRGRHPYRIYGYKGKQVRDNLHSHDVCTAIMAFAERPSRGAVLQPRRGGRTAMSVREAIARFEELFGPQPRNRVRWRSRGAATTSATSATSLAFPPRLSRGEIESGSTRTSSR
jgi:CDP-paratose 2-epimerase